MKRLSFVGLTLLTAWGCGGAPSAKHAKFLTGSAKFDAPPDWQRSTRTEKGKRLQVAQAPMKIGVSFRVNVSLLIEKNTATLEMYVDANKRSLKKKARNASLVASADFETVSTIQCRKLTYDNRFAGLDLRQVFYTFDNGNEKYVMTATCLRKDADQYASVFDEIAKSFRID